MPDEVNEIINPGHGVGIDEGDRIQSPVVHAQSDGAVLLMDHNYRGCPITRCWLDHPLFLHFFQLPLYHLSIGMWRSVGGKTNRVTIPRVGSVLGKARTPRHLGECVLVSS